jgi:hypothetical protein
VYVGFDLRWRRCQNAGIGVLAVFSTPSAPMRYFDFLGPKQLVRLFQYFAMSTGEILQKYEVDFND